MQGKLKGMPVVVACFEFAFMGGSMASVVGARFVAAVNACLENDMPLICFSASGGARMQEALMSLMQMAKTSAKLALLESFKSRKTLRSMWNLPFVGMPSLIVDLVS